MEQKTMNRKNLINLNKDDLEFYINREIGFVQKLEVLRTKEKLIDGSEIDQCMIYAYKIGGISETEFKKLEELGFKFCYLNPIELQYRDQDNKPFGNMRKGLLIVLRVV